MTTHPINGFEIAVDDLARASAFFEKVLGVELKRETFGGMPMAIVPGAGAESVSGALVRDEARRAGGGGSLVYLNVAGRLDACIGRVGASGGAVLVPKTSIGEQGAFALLRDTEGNTVGLHSP